MAAKEAELEQTVQSLAAGKGDEATAVASALEAKEAVYKEEQAKQTPFLWYVTPVLREVEAERDERAALGTGQPYNRQIP